VDLSEQQLVDCSHLYGNLGCDGGFNVQGLAYVRDHGITDTASYPYTAKNGQCKIHGGSFKFNKIHSVAGCKNLEAAILGRPVGVGVDAANWSRYASGIFSNCGKHLDHNVLLVGISDTYYKIKNSWSTAWGEKGFIRLALGNTCGICDDFSPWVE
jgi:C1A family cysteine protease